MATHNVGRILPIFKGNYDNTLTYEKLDIVYYKGCSYVAKETVRGVAPTNATKWQAVAIGSDQIVTKISDLENDVGFLVARDFNTLNGQSLINPNETPVDIPILTPADITSDTSGADEGKILSQLAGNRLNGELTKVDGNVKTVDGKVTTLTTNVQAIDEKVVKIEDQISSIGGGAKEVKFVSTTDSQGLPSYPNFESKFNSIDFGASPIFYFGDKLTDLSKVIADGSYRSVELSAIKDGKYSLIFNLKENRFLCKEISDILADEYIIGTYNVVKDNVSDIYFDFPFLTNNKYQQLENWEFTLKDGTIQNRQVFIYK